MFINFDIGGTYTKYAIFDNNKIMLDGFPKQEKTNKEPIETVKEIVIGSLKKWKIEKAGISVAANVNDVAEIVNSTNLQFRNKFNFSEFFKEKWGIRCVAVNDGSAATLGMAFFKEFSKFNSFVGVTLGTGIGGGVVINRKLLTTGNGFEGEIGHIVVVENGLQCNCGKKGCLEAYCGANGIVERYNKLSKRKLACSPKEIGMYAESGDVNALSVINETGKFLGKVFAIISDIIAPEAFILTGGVAGFEEKLVIPAKEILSQLCFSRIGNSFPQILINSNKNPALYGTLLLFDK